MPLPVQLSPQALWKIVILVDQRGFGFVEVATKEEGEAAISQFNGKELSGRSLKVNEAKPREPRSGGGGGRGSLVVVVVAEAGGGGGRGNGGGFSGGHREPRW